ncbi:Hypothetical protein LUCI_1888 [Lucifera butyrica]|uniref:Uncharacterized protein n=1 Tax=Lucifera butyrica TaxID=1351585 RepID=A0A498R8Q0_9FIRM|nr:hypothetical protein [Lucifera butyrica]VBB06652.1 Hypothetical protein LUCI_1888 [Lucifera butyrica]
MVHLMDRTGHTGIYRIVDNVSTETSRIWICDLCGAKVYQAKSGPTPQYKCLCGGKSWHRRPQR